AAWTAPVTRRAVWPRARSSASSAARPVTGHGWSITNGLHRQRHRIGSSQLARLSLVATAANGVFQQQARARGNRGQHEYRIEGGDRDPGGRAEPGCGEGPGGGAFPHPPPPPPILRGITIAVWTTISSATSSPRGAVLPATRAAMTNVAECPATTSTEASVSWGHTSGTSRP